MCHAKFLRSDIVLGVQNVEIEKIVLDVFNKSFCNSFKIVAAFLKLGEKFLGMKLINQLNVGENEIFFVDQLCRKLFGVKAYAVSFNSFLQLRYVF